MELSWNYTGQKTNKIGLLHRRIPQIQPNHPSLNPRPLHRLRGSHLLVPGHPNPTELDQTLRDLRCLRGPVLLRRLHRLRLRTTLHWLRKLQPLVRRLRRTLQIARPVRTPWETSRESTRAGPEEDVLDAQGVVCDRHHGGALLHVDGYSGFLFAFGTS